MPKPRSVKKPHRITVQFSGGTRDGQVTKLEWGEAQELIDNKKAIAISQNLFRAAKAGIDIRKIKGDDRRNDSLIKSKINAQRDQDVERQKKKAKAKDQVYNVEG